MNDESRSLIDRTLRRFARAWFSGKREGALKDAVAPDLPPDDLERIRAHVDACLDGRGGEVSARTRAADLGEAYLVLDRDGRRRFLGMLADDYDVDRGAIDEAIEARREAGDDGERRRLEAVLRETLVPPRIRLLARFNSLRLGMKFLVDLRAELMALSRDEPRLAVLDREVRDLLASWFDVGFLDLERITWDTRASLLEKLIEYEAVHAIRSWKDLKNRLEVDRRCYAFFHPHLPDEPLIFVQVALVDGMSASIQGLLDESAPLGDADRADSAVFYSISNCQPGLAGVSFGGFLIKRVADDIARRHANVKTFATLSPLPGFRGWLERRVAEGDDGLVDGAQADAAGLATGPARDGNGAAGAALLAALDAPRWWEDAERAAALEPVLMRLAARYLLRERHGGHRALDRVAHFHLSNGARVERLNWLADTSSNGLARSAGMMVNYRYVLDQIERNHEAYTGGGRIAAAAAVRKLAKG